MHLMLVLQDFLSILKPPLLWMPLVWIAGGRIILYQNDSFSIFLKVLGSKAPDPRAEYPQPEG